MRTYHVLGASKLDSLCPCPYGAYSGDRYYLVEEEIHSSSKQFMLKWAIITCLFRILPQSSNII